ncbi:hypothetical protein CDD83_778 [Cordyceps sp. RAO-2017]|nr:hypothetical protein CDD83_778 [Cordyceps sp. RAO-2017]
MISDMKLETHHRGKRTLLRVCTPANRMTAVMAIVEDQQGTAVLLQLYHQPEEADVPADDILWPGLVFIVKEPFFKCASDGSYSIRVDHPSDIIWLGEDDEYVPMNWRRATVQSESSPDYRTRGNEAVKNEKWAEAHALYSSAIRSARTAEEERLAYMNRSLANLKLGRPEQALSDAVRIRDAVSDAEQEKRLFREGRALYELERFEACRDTLEDLLKLFPHNAAANKELDRAQARLREQQTGEYDFRRMYRQSKATPPLVDCATFSSAVEVRASPGRGLGLFTKTPVSAGQLLLCEKAFAYSHCGDDSTRVLMNLCTKRMTAGSQAHLFTQVVQKLYHNPERSRPFRQLHRGAYAADTVLECDELPVVDSFLVERIISLNSFGAPRTSLAFVSNEMSPDHDKKDPSTRTHTTTGVWLVASRINHSCVGNCRRSFIGDMQIVRATRDMPADTELQFAYQHLRKHQSYKEAQKQLDNWGFVCNCPLCQMRKVTTEQALQRRKALDESLSKVLSGPLGTNVVRSQQILLEMAETYPSPEADAIRLELWDPYFAMGEQLVCSDRPAEAIQMIVKGLEALGYSITARPPMGSDKKPKLEVKRWGQPNDWTPHAFMNLLRAYKTLAPKLCPAAKAYVVTAYSMVVGEGATVRDTFPDFERRVRFLLVD